MNFFIDVASCRQVYVLLSFFFLCCVFFSIEYLSQTNTSAFVIFISLYSSYHNNHLNIKKNKEKKRIHECQRITRERKGNKVIQQQKNIYYSIQIKTQFRTFMLSIFVVFPFDERFREFSDP